MPYTLPPFATASSLPMPTAPAWPHRLAAWLAARLGLRRVPCSPTTAQSLLQQLLDRHPRSRRVFPHLAMMEDCLRREGPAGVRRLPDATRERARNELMAIATAAEAGPLLALLSEQPVPALAAPARTGAAAMEDVEVTEINEELFYEALREWEQSHPGAGIDNVASLSR